MEEFPGIDIEWVYWLRETIDSRELVRKLRKLKGNYPKSKNLKGNALRNFKFLTIKSRFPCSDSLYIKNLITQGKSIYEITEILLLNPNLSEKQWDESDLFRDEDYLNGAKAQLLNEFPNHWKSTIVNILIEANDYLKARKILQDIRPSWWSNLWNFIPRRIIRISQLQNAELNEQLNSIDREVQEKMDLELAKEINKEQYSACSQNITCQCCFNDYPWEEIGACSLGHLFCGNCIHEFVNQSLFGTNVMAGKEVTCVYLGSGCQGKFTDLNRFVPQNILDRYNIMLAQREVEKSGVKLVKCPFCYYSEEIVWERKSIYFRIKKWVISQFINYEQIKRIVPIASFVISVLATLFLNPRNVFLSIFISFYIRKKLDFIDVGHIIKRLHDSIREKSLILNCRYCLKSSCVNCSSEWKVDHECHEKERSNFRLFVESKMSEALLRTCPKCRISFSKSDGCNKITVYYITNISALVASTACALYVEQILEEKNIHISAITKCDLYMAPDDGNAVRKAAHEARMEWISNHPESLDRENLDLSIENIG